MEATMTYLPLCNGGSTARAIPTVMLAANG
jgi:hypothetical protein